MYYMQSLTYESKCQHGVHVGDSVLVQSSDRQRTSALLCLALACSLAYSLACSLTCSASAALVRRTRQCLLVSHKSLVSDHHPGWIHQISLPQICRVAPMDLEMLLGTAQLISHRFSIGSLPWTLRRTHPATLVVGDSWILRPSAVGSPADTGAMEPRPFPPLLIASSIFAVQSAVNVSTTLSGSMSWPLHSPSRVAHVIANPAFNLRLDIASPGNWVRTHAAFQRLVQGLSACCVLWCYGSVLTARPRNLEFH